MIATSMKAKVFCCLFTFSPRLLSSFFHPFIEHTTLLLFSWTLKFE